MRITTSNQAVTHPSLDNAFRNSRMEKYNSVEMLSRRIERPSLKHRLAVPAYAMSRGLLNLVVPIFRATRSLKLKQGY